MSVTTLVVLTVVEIGVLIAGLAFYLTWVSTLLARIATNLEDCNETVEKIIKDADQIVPGVEHINRSGGVVAGALPLLYGFAEKIVTAVSPAPAKPERHINRPYSGTRRSRLHEMVGYSPSRH